MDEARVTTTSPNTPDADGPASVVDSFVDYRRVVLDLSNDLRGLLKHAGDVGLDGAASEITAVLGRMESDRFSIAVVGEFKRGKSTFLNALLGVEVLPADVLPCSATLNRVTYGIEKRAVIEYRDGHVEQIAYDALPNYVTKLTDESEALAASVKEATVYYPSPYCRNNVDVIDTPGLNEDEAMTAVTLTVLPRADAAILVIMAQSPFGEFERDFLESRLLTADLGRVVFVVNGVDRLNSPEDVGRVVAGVERRIQANVMERARRQLGETSQEFELYMRKIGKPKVFGLSAREALEAKKAGDLGRLDRSGFPVFEASLQKFLTEHRGVVMLHVPLNRCLTASRNLLEAIPLSEAALSLKAEDFQRACEASEAEVAALRQAWEQEKTRIDDSGKLLRHEAGMLAESYCNDYREATLQAISSTPVTAADIADKRAKQQLNARLVKAMDTAKSRVIDDCATKLDALVKSRVLQEGQRLSSWSGEIQALMPTLRRNFTGEVDDATSRSAVADTIVDGVSILVPGVAGALAGYRSAGVKGIGTGLAGGLAASALTLGVAVAVSTVVALPVLPVFLAMGAASFMGGKWLSNKVFEDSRVERYVETVRAQFLRQMESEMLPAHVRAQFERGAADAFEVFRQQVHATSEAALADGLSVIAKRRAEHIRSQANVEAERERLADIRRDVERIRDRAARLSGQLVQFTEA